MRHPWVSIDLEWPASQRKGRVACITWWRPGMTQAEISTDVNRAFVKLCREHDYIVGHGIASDLQMISSTSEGMREFVWGLYDTDSVRCTMLRAQLIDIALGRTGHDDWGQSYTLEAITGGAKDSDNPWRLRFGELIDIPLERWPKDAIRYALNDPRQAGIWWMNNEDFIPPDEWFQVKKAWALQLVEERGIGVDQARVEYTLDKLDQKRDKLFRLLYKQGIARADGGLIEAKQRERLDPKGKKTAGGKLSLEADVLEASRDPWLQRVVDYKKLGKTRSFLQALENHKRIHTHFRSLLATGRTSCYEPNIQQIPKLGGVRDCFIPLDSDYFVDADYSQLELCTLAQTCFELFGVSRMGEMINEGLDLHLELAKRLNPSDPMSARPVAKMINFGRGGGMGDPKFVATAWKWGRIELTVQRAKADKQIWLAMFPEMKRYFRYMSALTEHNGGVCTITQTWSGRPRGACYYPQACNTLFQGPAADGAGLALYLAVRAGMPVVNFVHDQIITEGGDQEALRNIMIAAMRQITPRVTIRVNTKETPRWLGKNN